MCVCACVRASVRACVRACVCVCVCVRVCRRVGICVLRAYVCVRVLSVSHSWLCIINLALRSMYRFSIMLMIYFRSLELNRSSSKALPVGLETMIFRRSVGHPTHRTTAHYVLIVTCKLTIFLLSL